MSLDFLNVITAVSQKTLRLTVLLSFSIIPCKKFNRIKIPNLFDQSINWNSTCRYVSHAAVSNQSFHFLDAMTFNGNSYVRYSLRDEKTKISSFSVSMRTTKPSGTIFSVKGSHDYFILEVHVIHYIALCSLLAAALCDLQLLPMIVICMYLTSIQSIYCNAMFHEAILPEAILPVRV